MANKLLFVDDEPQILEGIRRLLYREYQVSVAEGGEQGLSSIKSFGPFEVVVSDMRMPGMNGAQFLAKVREIAPDTVRMLLTGYTDLSAAIEAVNQGNIFRFLTKPCDKTVLTKALADGLEQHRLVRAEKDLLEKTLMGSIKVLTDVLGAASPEAFGRSMRIARYVRHLSARSNLPSPWRFEAAAMLSQLGCVTLDPELIQASYALERLSPEEKNRFLAHPQKARELLLNVPRLEPIAWMIGQQFETGNAKVQPDQTAEWDQDILLGAKILKLAVALDNLKMRGLSDDDAFRKLKERRDEFGEQLLQRLEDITPQSPTREQRKVLASKLSAGMILDQEIRTKAGMLVVPKGQEITQALVMKLGDYAQAGTIDKDIMVSVPV